ncbi:transglutaminase-like domain-containing protein [Paenibacillus sanguinis]|uniref:transglutaminase-like domain-containing protein n=1 Tax=Paenibacillus sanguinis TaxID=225906 RepID=UPI000369DEE2|nr:transglutaminase-like domain-containing protein [Paenibacillus sanguinis]
MSVPESEPMSVMARAGRRLTPGHQSPRGLYEGQGALSALMRLAISLLLFGLFSEWLYPLQHLVAAGSSRATILFFVLTGLLLLIGCFRLPSTLFMLGPPLFIAASMLYLYGSEEGVGWFFSYADLLRADLSEFLSSGRLYAVSMESRALLLLIGWTLLVVSVQMLALARQSIWLFLAATFVYLLTLEAVAGLELYLGVIRVAALGLVLQALAFQRSESAASRGTGTVTAAGFVLVGVACAALLSSLLPSQPVRAISWEQMVRAVSDWSGAQWRERKGSVAAFSVSGYGLDDSRLGAPMQLRHDPYFTALSPYSTYWRGESKSVYTGRGWVQSSDITGEALEAAVQENGMNTIKQTIMFEEPVSGRVPLLSGGLPLELERVITGNRSSPIQVQPRYDGLSDSLFIEDAALSEQIYGYELLSKIPPSSKMVLLETQGQDKPYISEHFLQLPDSLPERVKELGRRLVAGEDSRYDAVTAVQRYLQKNYEYQLNSQLPPDGADFVDRFLFEDKIGYCDHFSTAMVVLLRSGGVPARWVKGFAPGDPAANSDTQELATAGQGLRRYTVSYADAHSWVEVYFPSSGWIPFDPTPGFAGFTGTAGADAKASLNSRIEGIADQLAALWKIRGELVHLFMMKLAALATDWRMAIGTWRLSPFVMTAWFLGVGLVFLLLREIPQYVRAIQAWLDLHPASRQFPGRKELLRAADRVWAELALRHGPKPSRMTAREYMQSVFQGKARMPEETEGFVQAWERLYYGREQLDRRESIKFLQQCRGFVASCGANPSKSR